jgi:hypothetical protein
MLIGHLVVVDQGADVVEVVAQIALVTDAKSLRVDVDAHHQVAALSAKGGHYVSP